MRKVLLLVWVMGLAAAMGASPVAGLLERIDPGASERFIFERAEARADEEAFFELDWREGKPVVRGDSEVSLAAGLNWYLKYYAGIHLSWDRMRAELPEVLPEVRVRERRSTACRYRYYLNYCTFSYTMAFWDWARWEREIDWMALHGVNLALATVGTDAVWRNVLLRLGYSGEEADRFIAGPGYQAWWLMNNLEGVGGPNGTSWYGRRVALQRRILGRMGEFGIRAVLPGYSGMVPHDARERLGLEVTDPGVWCGYRRPAFLSPTDGRFGEIAALYYEEQERLFGKSGFYGMDPFHEGGRTAGVDLRAAGRAIRDAMKAHDGEGIWVIQAWGDNPKEAMTAGIPRGDLLVLDLWAESNPRWARAPETGAEAPFGGHDWVYCMLLNFGGNVGLHGKMDHLIASYYRAARGPAGRRLRGVGMTPEGTENNPVMFELLSELPWRPEPFDRAAWLEAYAAARYGRRDGRVAEAWRLLAGSVYACPPESAQQGTQESLFCARPGLGLRQVSTWAGASDYYDPQAVIRAAGLMAEAAEEFRGNACFGYDLTDTVRQAVAEGGRMLYADIGEALRREDRAALRRASERFLELLLLQDRLLGTRAEFRLGRWLTAARALGETPEERERFERNARRLITTWGDRTAADAGGLHDYAHREWNGLLGSLYHSRWKAWLDALAARQPGDPMPAIDFYAMEAAWAEEGHGPYGTEPEGDCIDTARAVYARLTAILGEREAR